MGNIYDEFDDETNIVKLNDNKYLVNLDTVIHKINHELEFEFAEENVNFDVTVVV